MWKMYVPKREIQHKVTRLFACEILNVLLNHTLAYKIYDVSKV